MIEQYNGDIFDSPSQIIIHSANCFHTMGTGIAKEIKRRYPRAFEVDCMTKKGDRGKLGQFSFALSNFNQPQTIINAYTQYMLGRDRVYVDYDAFYKALENIRGWLIEMRMNHQIIGIHYKISCNNAGGDWNKIQSIINYVFGVEGEGFKVLICKKD